MAYPQFIYPGYQPYYPQPVPDQLAQLRQQMMQPAQMPPSNQPQQMQPQFQQAAPQNGGINWVGSKQEADNYPIAPGSAVALWDANNPIVYLRQADSTGKPSTKVYELVERTDNPQQQNPPQIDLTQFITRDQLEEILADRLKRPTRANQKKEDADNG